MPKFLIIERRTDTYSCVIEARNKKHARQLYDADDEEIFGDQWEQDSSDATELVDIIRFDGNAVQTPAGVHILADVKKKQRRKS